MARQDWNWKDSTEVAKIVRKIVKENWPTVKFSVRTHKYAGGASIDVRWLDGPTAEQMDREIKHLQAVSHIDITDYAHHTTSTHEGETFHSGAHYIFAERKVSKELMEWAARKMATRLGLPVLNILESDYDQQGYVDPEDPNVHLHTDEPEVWYPSVVRSLAYRTSEQDYVSQLAEVK